MDGTQPTMPAKQQRMSMLDMRDAAQANAVVMAEEDVTSTEMVCIGLLGKAVLSKSMLSVDEAKVEGRSMRQMAEAPCSRRATAEARARLPAPPVRTQLPEMAKR